MAIYICKDLNGDLTTAHNVAETAIMFTLGPLCKAPTIPEWILLELKIIEIHASTWLVS